ncbi:unnamed protein product, partial [Mesorhabditis spiculigera]
MRTLFTLYFYLTFGRSAVTLDNKPIALYVTLLIEDIHEFDWQTGEFESTVELLLASDSPNAKSLELATIEAQNEPHPFVDCAFDAYKVQMLSYLRWVVKSFGDILSSKRRARVRSICHLPSGQFPFERQHCSIRVISPRHSSAELALQWARTSKPVRTSHPRYRTASGAEITDFTPVACTYDSIYTITNAETRSARHSCLEAQFYVRRPVLPFLIRYLLPSITFLITIFLQNAHEKYQNLARQNELVREESRRRYEKRLVNKISHQRPPDNKVDQNGNDHQNSHTPLLNTYERALSNGFQAKADQLSLRAARWDLIGRSAALPIYAISILVFFVWNLWLKEEWDS